MSERMDTLPTRMIDVIDALPVPAGPGAVRSRARRTSVLRLNPVPIVILLALVLVLVGVTPAGRAAVNDLGRLIERVFGLGPWPAYYGTLTTDPDGVQRERLLFWDGSSPGRSVLVAASSGWRGGWWSPDRAAMAVATGSSIYIGDRSGVLREVADLDPLIVMAVDWVGSDRIAALARAPDPGATSAQGGVGTGVGTDWLIHVDVRTGDVSRRLLPEAARPARQIGLLGMFDASGVPPWRKFSPDGRWLITGDRACRSVAVYDLASDRRIELADGVQTRGIPFGWLRGSVLVWATCDLATGTLHVRAGHPDAAATEIGSVPLSAISEPIGPAIDQARDRVLFHGRDGDDWVIYAITLEGEQVELARLRVTIESPLGGIQAIDISRDGRLLAFNRIDWAGIGYGNTLQLVARTGVVDLGTGEITWACELNCAKLRLR